MGLAARLIVTGNTELYPRQGGEGGVGRSVGIVADGALARSDGPVQIAGRILAVVARVAECAAPLAGFTLLWQVAVFALPLEVAGVKLVGAVATGAVELVRRFDHTRRRFQDHVIVPGLNGQGKRE